MPRLGAWSPPSVDLVGRAAGGEAVGEVAAGERGAVGALLRACVDAVEIDLARRAASARGCGR